MKGQQSSPLKAAKEAAKKAKEWKKDIRIIGQKYQRRESERVAAKQQRIDSKKNEDPRKMPLSDSAEALPLKHS